MKNPRTSFLCKANYFCIYALGLLAALFTSCTSEGFDDVQRQHALETFASKNLILSLSPEEQKQAWISRLETYFELDLNSPQKGILKEMVLDLKEIEKGKFFLSENLKQNAVAMAKITPREDFLKLFCEATTSLPVLRKTGLPCVVCITDLENYVNANTNHDNSVTLRAENCVCSWTCQQQEDNLLCPDGEYATTLSPCQGGQTTGCCNQTSSGCGFLFLFGCTGLASCEPI
jgi:hypothetical protein